MSEKLSILIPMAGLGSRLRPFNLEQTQTSAFAGWCHRAGPSFSDVQDHSQPR